MEKCGQCGAVIQDPFEFERCDVCRTILCHECKGHADDVIKCDVCRRD